MQIKIIYGNAKSCTIPFTQPSLTAVNGMIRINTFPYRKQEKTIKKKTPLYAQIFHKMREQILAGIYRPGERLPSENEIAEYFGVSIITSKRVLNDLADENLIIRIKGKGSFVAGKDGTDVLRSERSNFKGVVGVIFPSICMPVESQLFYNIQSEMHAKKYQTLIHVTDDRADKETEAIRMFRIFGVRGFIIFPAINETYNEEILRLSLERFPHVLVDRNLPNITSSNVISDNEEAMMNIVSHLLDNKHSFIAFITQQDTNSNTHERIMGYENALANHALPIDRALWFTKKAGTSDKLVIEQLKEFFLMRPNVTAAVTVDSPLASLSYAALNEIGRKIHDDVMLVSFDDPKLPFVPHVKQDVAEIARRAVGILITQMECGYNIVYEKIPVKFMPDVEYPTPFGLELD